MLSFISSIASASWNPFNKAPIAKDIVIKEESTRSTMEWIELIFITIVVPFGLVFAILHFFGVLKWFKRKFSKTRRRRRSAGVLARARTIFKGRRRVSTSARSKQLAALARGRATRKRNARARKKK